MPKLPCSEKTIVPDVQFQNEKGKWIDNRAFPFDEQVKCEIERASIRQIDVYRRSYTAIDKSNKSSKEIKIYTDSAYEKAVSKHVTKIENLVVPIKGKQTAITNGKQLMEWGDSYANDLIQDLFMRICGIRLDDDDTPSDGSEELTAGEDKASS